MIAIHILAQFTSYNGELHIMNSVLSVVPEGIADKNKLS